MSQRRPRRHRLNDLEVAVLRSEFLKDPVWSKAKIEQLASQLNLTCVKVYKWHYDEGRRARQQFNL